MALTGFPLPPLLVGLGFGDRALRRFADRMNAAGRYHVFRSGSRHYLNGELVYDGAYRKRGHASAGAWIERDAEGRVVAEDVVCFDEFVTEKEIAARAGPSVPPRPNAAPGPPVPSWPRTSGSALRTA